METHTESGNTPGFAAWCIVSLFGHTKLIGYVTETKLAGGAFLQVDAPDADGNPKFSTFVSPASIYSIQPIDKAMALEMARECNTNPVSVYDVPKLREDIKTELVLSGKVVPTLPTGADESAADHLF